MIWQEWLGLPALRMVEGIFSLPERPGLGFELSEKARAKYPFQEARAMPQFFHEDGSVAAW